MRRVRKSNVGESSRVLFAAAALALVAPLAEASRTEPPSPHASPSPHATPSTHATPSPRAAAPEPPGGPAKEADVRSLDAIITAVYDVVSGPADEPRDWTRMRTLFHEKARLMPAGLRPGGAFRLAVLDLDGYIAGSAPYFAKEGFFEREIARRVERYGHIAHAFSTYEARRSPEEKPFARGINSFQLVYDGSRWWVLSILWEAESERLPIPKEYLGDPRGDDRR